MKKISDKTYKRFGEYIQVQVFNDGESRITTGFSRHPGCYGFTLTKSKTRKLIKQLQAALKQEPK